MDKKIIGLIVIIVMFLSSCNGNIKQENNNTDILQAGGWIAEDEKSIYYNDFVKNKIYSRNKETDKKIEIAECTGRSINVYNDFLFYINNEDSNIYKINLSDNSKQKITNKKITEMVVSGDNIYCTENKSLLKMNTNGEVLNVLSKDAYRFICKGNLVYYVAGNNVIYKVENEEKSKIITIDTNELVWFNVYCGMVYYTTGNMEFFSYNIEERTKRKITENFVHPSAVSIYGGNIYYIDMVKNCMCIYDIWDRKIKKSFDNVYDDRIFIVDNRIFYLNEGIEWNFTDLNGKNSAVF